MKGTSKERYYSGFGELTVSDSLQKSPNVIAILLKTF